MAKKKQYADLLGSWSFLVGVVLAGILGILATYYSAGMNQTMVWLLVVIGVIVGLFNISEKETRPFLLSGAVLIIAGAFGSGVLSKVAVLGNVFDALLMIFVPATVIVALRNVFSLANN